MIVYLGNILSKGGGSVGFIETLTSRLSDRYQVKAASAIRYKLLRLLHMLYTVLRNRMQCDVVLIDTFSTQAFWFAAILAFVCRAIRIPYICIIRGGNFPERMNGSPQAVRTLLSGAAKVVVPSEYLGQAINGVGFKTITIPNFINLEMYAFKRRESLKPRLLWVRAFNKIYNPVMAVEVLDIILKSFPEAELCMVGADNDGTLSSVKARIESLGLQKHVELTGRLPKEEWVSRSTESDIFINTTHIDNMPVSVVEALALGLPVVTTNVGGISALVSHEVTALLVKDGDVASMASEVLRLLNSRTLAVELSNNGRKLAEAFSWERVGVTWNSILDPFVQR